MGKKVGQLIDVEVNDDDISTSHRLPLPKTTFGDARLKEPAIIVKLLKDAIFGKSYIQLGSSFGAKQPEIWDWFAIPHERSLYRKV